MVILEVKVGAEDVDIFLINLIHNIFLGNHNDIVSKDFFANVLFDVSVDQHIASLSIEVCGQEI